MLRDEIQGYACYIEVYEVVQTAELVAQIGEETRTYRIEILEWHGRGTSPGGNFSARYYEQRDGCFRAMSEPGYVRKHDADSALGQALGLLQLHLNQKQPHE